MKWRKGVSLLWRRGVSLLWGEGVNLSGFSRRIQARKSEEKRKEKERWEKELKIRRENDLALFREILGKATRWHKADNLRKYIDVVEQNAIRDNKHDELKEFLLWARNKADWYDPFIEKDDELLRDVDMETLAFKTSSYF